MTKHILYDISNTGLLFVTDNIAVTAILKHGLIDAENRTLYAFHDGYDKINRTMSMESTDHWCIPLDGECIKLPDSALNSNYLRRRELARIRAPLVEKLVRYSVTACKSLYFTPWEGFENNLQSVIKNSDPATDTWSPYLLEYAAICDLSPAAAYREIKLHADTSQRTKMRVYAMMLVFRDMIANLYDRETVPALENEMTNRFFRDGWT
jgi:hypothetical protein